MFEVDEISKALSETAKFGTVSVETTKKMLSFLAKVFQEPIDTTVGIIGDKLKFIRWQRQVRMVDEINRILQRRGIDKTRPISPKFAIPMLEQASLEEDDSLQDIWNKLIANNLDPDFKSEIRYSYIEIIKSLNILDAKILAAMYDALLHQGKDLSKITEHTFTKENIAEILNVPGDECIVSIYNLFRVQCLAPAILKAGAFFGEEPITIFKGADVVTVTPLGLAFVEACIK